MDPGTKRICILSMTPIRDGPRPRREAKTLTELGYDVVSLGFSTDRAVDRGNGSGRYLEFKEPSGTIKRIGTLLRGAVGSVVPRLATVAFWSSRVNRRFYDALEKAKPDLVIAHDWYVVPIADRLLTRCGIPFVYEAHEYFPEHRMDSKVWRTLIRRYAIAIERQYIVRASAVITVSEGIADAIQGFHNLPRRPTVIRSVPVMEEAKSNSDDDARQDSEERAIEVLYHGIFTSARRLDYLIESVPLWDDRFLLVLRGGFGPPQYERSLRKRVEELELGGRVRFDDPVAPEALVDAARASDIGVSLLPAGSLQEKHALPNKVFEYIMAGLAVVVLEGTEPAKLIAEYDCGLSITNTEPESIANALNSVSASDVQRWKDASNRAREFLSWESEKLLLVRCVEGLVGASGGQTTPPGG